MNKDKEFYSGIILGIFITIIIILMFNLTIVPIFNEYKQNKMEAKEYCSDKDKHVYGFTCKSIDISNTSIIRFEKQCIVKCGEKFK